MTDDSLFYGTAATADFVILLQPRPQEEEEDLLRVSWAVTETNSQLTETGRVDEKNNKDFY